MKKQTKASTILLTMFLVLSVFAVIMPAAATQAIGYTVPCFVGIGDRGHLYKVDLTTGTATDIGPIGFGGVQALSFDANGVLYGIAGSDLITIDLATGAGTMMGSTSTSSAYPGLTFDPSGNLWMGTRWNFYSINPATGAATLIGALGHEAIGLASSTDGTIYGLGGYRSGATYSKLVTINTATGSATEVGPLVTFDIDDGGIDFDSSGTLWGIEDRGRIFTIDPSTGQATVVAWSVRGCKGLAIPKEAPVEPYVVSSDDSGTKRNTFELAEDVYCYAGNLPGSTDVRIYVVANKDVWNDGTGLTDVSGGYETELTESDGSIATTKIWSATLTEGVYDIVVDTNRNGEWDIGEPIDSDVDVGFTAVPEFTTIAIPVAAVVGLVFLMSRRSRHSRRKN